MRATLVLLGPQAPHLLRHSHALLARSNKGHLATTGAVTAGCNRFHSNFWRTRAGMNNPPNAAAASAAPASAAAFASDYLAALGVASEPPSLQFLATIYTAHCTRFAFNSAHVLQGSPMLDDADEAWRALLHRGGVCVEHANVMAKALQGLGFEAAVRAGEVFQPKKGEFGFPWTHRVVLVHLGQDTYMLDPGYPIKTLAPIRLVASLEQLQPNGVTALMTHEASPHDGGTWVLSTKALSDGAGELVPVHRTHMCKLGRAALASAMGMHYTAVSPFQGGWVAAIAGSDTSIASLAAGSWAGANVPPDHAKYVLRPPAPAPEIVEMVPLDSTRMAQLWAQFRVASPVPGGVEDEKGRGKPLD